MNAALYVRVSTQEQAKHGLSVDDQIQALKKYCEDNNLTAYKVYNDAGISGHASYRKRPKLLELIADCQAQKIDLILFTRIDRWFRSVKDYYLVSEQLCGVPWKAIWEDYETETSAGKFKVNIMLSISEAEAARTSEKVKSVLQYKKTKGEYLGTPPWGFKVESKRLVIDSDVAPLVNLMFATYLQTSSSCQVQKALSDAGAYFIISTIRSRLKNPQYVGAYITQQQHEQIVEAMERKHIRNTKDNAVYIFSGLAVCGYCGGRMGGTRYYNKLKSGEVHYGLRYRCEGNTCGKPHAKRIFITEQALEKQMLELIEPVLNKVTIEKLEVKKKNAKKIDPSKLEAKLKRIGIRFEDGDISVEEYRQKRNDIMRQLRDLKSVDDEPIALPNNWRSMYDDLDSFGRRAFWRSFISEIKITRENRHSLGYNDISTL